MIIPDPTDRIILPGRALVRAIEALDTVEPSGRVERALARPPMAAYKRRLRAIVAAAPTWVGEELLSASERIWDNGAVFHPTLPTGGAHCRQPARPQHRPGPRLWPRRRGALPGDGPHRRGA